MSSSNNHFQTPEAVAYQLMQDIFTVERKLIIGSSNPKEPYSDRQLTQATKDDILGTYKECILAVKTGR